MVSARSSTSPRGAADGRPPAGPAAAWLRPGGDWRLWAIVGLCFGLGYGVSFRLLNLGGEQGRSPTQSFDVQPFPGTTLESLRQRFGGEAKDIRSDLDLIDLQEQQKQEAARLEERRAAMEARDAQVRQGLEGAPEGTAGSPQGPPVAGPSDIPPAPALPPALERGRPGPAPVVPPSSSAPAAPGTQP